MRIESLGLLPSQPNHNKRWAMFSVGSPFELAIVVDLLAMRGYEVIEVQTGQLHSGRLLTNMPWSEMLELKGQAMGTCLPTYSGEEEAADKKAADLKARTELERADAYDRKMRKMIGISQSTAP